MKHYVKRIIFTKTPLAGKYRYEDLFQIYPLNIENAPNSEKTRHYPIIIEFWYETDDAQPVTVFETESTNQSIAELTLQTNKLREYMNLLSAITNHRFFDYSKHELSWSIPIERPEEELEQLSSELSVNIYRYPNMGNDLKITEFSTPFAQDVLFLPPKTYYYNNPIENRDGFIIFPNTIDDILSKYFDLTSDEYIVATSCIYQICNGLDLLYKIDSLSFFSFVSAIETLVNYEFRNEKLEYECHDCKALKESSRKCKRCGSNIWGVSAKYREFLFKYVSNEPKAKKIYNKIYDIRSKISHTDFLFNGELFIDWNHDDKTEEVRMHHLRAMQLSRRSLVYWLQKKDL